MPETARTAAMTQKTASSLPTEGGVPRRRGLRRAILLLSLVAVAVGAYALAVVLGAPWLVDRALLEYTAASPGRTGSVGAVRVNPFTFRAELAGVELRDERARVALAASRVAMKLSPRTLSERHLVFDTVTIEQPWLSMETPSRVALPRERLDALRIERLDIDDGELQLLDTEGGAGPLSIGSITITARRLDGRATGAGTRTAGGYAVRAVDGTGAEWQLEGGFATGFNRTSGRVTVTGLDIAGAFPWVAPHLVPMSPRGSLDLDGEYVLDAAPARRSIEGSGEFRDLRFEPTPGLVVSTPVVAGGVSVVYPSAEGMADARGRIELTDARFDLVDARVSPPSSFALSNVSATFVSGSSEPLAMELEGQLAGGGTMSLALEGQGGQGDGQRSLGFVLQRVPAPSLSAYAVRALGRGLLAGSVGLEIATGQRGASVERAFRITTTRLVFEGAAGTSGEEPAGALPLELAAALLEDPGGVIDLAVPLGPIPSGYAGLGSVMSQALRARIASIGAAPFGELGRLAGRDPASLSAVTFTPGAASLSAEALDMLQALGSALKERPRIGLRVSGGFDAVADRDALATRQIELHVLLATAGGAPPSGGERVDFASPRAQDVLDEFAGERLPAARLAALGSRFDFDGNGDVDTVARTDYYRAVFGALVEGEPIADAALARLGRFRAQSVVDALTRFGIAAERVELGGGEAALEETPAVTLPIEVYALPR